MYMVTMCTSVPIASGYLLRKLLPLYSKGIFQFIYNRGIFQLHLKKIAFQKKSCEFCKGGNQTFSITATTFIDMKSV